jgi:DNA helicase II / ATP-dependent DNA helicase PcrA
MHPAVDLHQQGGQGNDARVTDLLGGELSGLWGGTFHSIGARVLRRHARALGYEPDFSILDREDAKDLLQACLGEMEIDRKADRLSQADVLADIFSLAINKDLNRSRPFCEQFDYFSAGGPANRAGAGALPARKKTANAWTSTICSRSGSNLCGNNPKCARNSAPLPIHPGR